MSTDVEDDAVNPDWAGVLMRVAVRVNERPPEPLHGLRGVVPRRGILDDSPGAPFDLPAERGDYWRWWGTWWCWNGAEWEIWGWYGRGWLQWRFGQWSWPPPPDNTMAAQAPLGLPEVVAVASLSAFLGAFTASFSKDLGQKAGTAAARAAAGAAEWAWEGLRDHFRRFHRGEWRPEAIEIHDEQQVLLVTGVEVDQLPETAWQQLAGLEFPQSPGRLRWDPYRQRWRIQKVFKPKG